MYSKMFYCVMSSYSILSKSAIFTNRGIEDGAFCIGTFFFPHHSDPIHLSIELIDVYTITLIFRILVCDGKIAASHGPLVINCHTDAA